MSLTYLGNTVLNSLYLGQTKINNIQQIVRNISILGPSASTKYPNIGTLQTDITGGALTNFNIEGTNVYATSTEPYTPENLMFGTQSGIDTVIMDDALVVSEDMFRGSLVQNVSMKNATIVKDTAFFAGDLRTVNLPKVESFEGEQNFRLNVLLVTLDLPSLTSVPPGGRPFINTLTNFSASSLTTIFSEMFYGSDVQNIYAPNVTSIQANAFSGAGTTTYSGSLVSSIADAAFQSAASMQQIWLPSLSGSTAIGGSTGQTNTFTGVAVSGSISVPSFYSTVNGGSPDGDLVYLSSSRGWTINYL